MDRRGLQFSQMTWTAMKTPKTAAGMAVPLLQRVTPSPPQCLIYSNMFYITADRDPRIQARPQKITLALRTMRPMPTRAPPAMAPAVP
jgi:hypothetical protein